MIQRQGLYILFKRVSSVCFASLIGCFLMIEGAWAPPPPPPDPTATVPAGDWWGYVSLIVAISAYARWSKRKSKNHRSEDKR